MANKYLVFLFILFYLYNSSLQAQNNVNYIKSWTADAPTQDPYVLRNLGLREVKQASAFFDGLGRPIQTVVKNGSLITSTGVTGDMVIVNQYDAFGRETKKLLPYVSAGVDGEYKTNSLIEQNSFNTAQYGGQGETFFYGQTDFESSPLNRPIKAMAPGNSWVGANQGTSLQYLFNTANDDVKIWSVSNGVDKTVTISDNGNGTQAVTWTWLTLPNNVSTLVLLYRYVGSSNWITAFVTGSNTIASYNIPSGNYEYAVQLYFNDGTPTYITNFSIVPTSDKTFTAIGSYLPGQLHKMLTTDEAGHSIIEYKDREDKVILRKVQLDSDISNKPAHSGWLCTYYLYNDYGQLIYVLQPKLVQYLDNNNFSPILISQFSELIFQYVYDTRNRLIGKKVPGADWTYLIYDLRDRLIMAQDANMRKNNNWLCTIYDNINRPVKSYLWSNASTNIALQSIINNNPDYVTNGCINSGELLTETHYDKYDNMPTGLSSNLVGNYASTMVINYNTSPDYAQPLVPNTSPLGMTTWTKVKVLGTSNQYIYSATIYDDKGRVIQVQSINQTGGLDINTTQYDFVGKVLRKHTTTNNTIANIGIEVANKPTYDDLGRIIKLEKNINNNGFKVISTVAYDALGQLVTKTLGTKPGTINTALETLTNEYNIRGWLLGINRDFAKTYGATGRFFGLDLGYDKTLITSINGNYAKAQLNGNISGMVWKTSGDGELRKYDFDYDNANRLILADFNQKDYGSWNKSTINYSVNNLNYDANGNILTMAQYGWKVGGSILIDDLHYTYQPNSNKLQNVIDFANDTQTYLGDFKTSATHPQNSIKSYITNSATYLGSSSTIKDYDYDFNGNMNTDYNKNISSITYNHLNLPQMTSITGKGTITYTYDAAGNKLQKTTQENNAIIYYNNNSYNTNIITMTRYTDAGVYESKSYSNSALSALQIPETLQFIGHEEGRFRLIPATATTTATWVADYFIKDHLGNTRVVLTDEQKVNSYPAATLEDGAVSTEQSYYNINTSHIVDKSSIPAFVNTTDPTFHYHNNNGKPPYNSNPSSNTDAESNKLYKLNAANGGDRIGLGITLKVMAGDKIDIYGKSFWKDYNTGGNNSNNNLAPPSIITGLLNTSNNGTHIGENYVLQNQINQYQLSYYSILNSFLLYSSGRVPYYYTTTQKPKAFINYIVFDEQYNYVTGNASAVGEVNTVKDHNSIDAVLQGIVIPKNGYIYVFCSNESPVDVFFDNLQVIHTPGPLLEETHYYPFGLTMSGISAKAANSIGNKLKYNGKELQSEEFTDGSGLDVYDYNARMQDPQIGKFLQIDPHAGSYFSQSPYTYVKNNPIIGTDPTGMDVYLEGEAAQESFKALQRSYANRDNSGVAYDLGGIDYFEKVGLAAIEHYGDDAGFQVNDVMVGFANSEIKDANDKGYRFGERYEAPTLAQREAKKIMTCTDFIGRVFKAAGILKKLMDWNISDYRDFLENPNNNFSRSDKPSIGSIWLVDYEVDYTDENGKPQHKHEGHISIIFNVRDGGKYIDLLHARPLDKDKDTGKPFGGIGPTTKTVISEYNRIHNKRKDNLMFFSYKIFR
ncbi:DUF6443 domain-containing protein [Parasediminibacterium paludis]|uniref:DUF6443 domain-containing protein n=1 Tax=Parasediminibacterium paludis TaxID=908966 RepID=A0ABV8PTP4_9BACT